MEKISTEQFLSIIQDAAEALPKLASERDAWKDKYEQAQTKIAAFERRDTVTKIANAMVAKGLDGGASYPELLERLEVWAQQGKLAEVERAVDLAGPDMGQKIAQVHDGGMSSSSGYEIGVEPGNGGNGDLIGYLLNG